jgi:ABC-type nitrate/sulfonate/bicarbonate transport system substrate-binding protein
MYVRNAARRIGRRGRKTGMALAVGCVAVTLVAACGGGSGGGSASSGSGGDPIDIKLGYPLPNVQSVAVQIATKNGVFQKNGLNVTATSLGTANVVNAALTSGSVNYSLTSASQLITSVAKGAGVIAISAYTVGTPVDVIFSNKFMAQKNLTKTTPIDQLVKALGGGHIGVSSPVIKDQEGSLLKAYNVNPSSVQTLTVSSEGGLANLLKAGQIDAFIAGPPVPQEAQAQGAGTILITGQNAPVWNAGNANLVLAANKAYATSHPDETKKVVAAVHAAVEYVKQHPNDASQQSASLLQATQQEVSESLPLAGYTTCSRMSADLWQKTVQYSIASGTLPSSATADENKVWTNAYAAQQSC